MVGVFAKSPRGRANALRSKYFSDDRVGMTRISPAASLQSEAAFDSFQPAEVLREPSELDQPIQCPSPESSIMEEGILWRPRILENLRRRNDIWSASIQQESILRGGIIPNRRSLEHFLFAGHGAPEYEFRKIA